MLRVRVCVCICCVCVRVCVCMCCVCAGMCCVCVCACVCVCVVCVCVCVVCEVQVCLCGVCGACVCIKEPHFDSLGLGQMQTHSTLDQLSHSCPTDQVERGLVTTRSSKNEAHVLPPIQSISGCLSCSGKMKIQTDQPYSVKFRYSLYLIGQFRYCFSALGQST